MQQIAYVHWKRGAHGFRNGVGLEIRAHYEQPKRANRLLGRNWSSDAPACIVHVLISWGHVSDVADIQANVIRRLTGSLPDNFNEHPIMSNVSTKNGVASNAAKPRRRLSGREGFGWRVFALGISSAFIFAAT